jgi:hypothetical protein
VELQLPAAAAAAAAAGKAAVLVEPSAARLVARHMAEAHAVRWSLRACLADGSGAPDQSPWAAPWRSRCWAVLRGGSREDVGVYTQWQ